MRLQASETLRGLIDSIVLTPQDGQPPSRSGDDSRSGEPRLRIELRGNLAAMLSAAQPPSRASDAARAAASLAVAFGGGGKTNRSPETGDLFVPVQVVAAACNQRYLQLWSGAA